MTVQELIEKLSKVPPETEINFRMQDGCCADWMDLEIRYVEASVDKYYGKTYTTCIVEFHAIDGFQTCISSGATTNFIKSRSKRD